MLTEDAGIVQECLSGESEAFGILVDKYKAGIYAFTYAKLGNFHDAQDVTQEVFLQAYRGLRSLRRWENFAFWLYRIAYNLCRKLIRAQSRRPDRDFIEDQDPKTLEARSLDYYREEQVSESLQEALYSMPEAYREVLTLYYFGGMNSVDIARALGTSPAAIRKRLSRARAQLREEMIATMETALKGQKLQASFTFRIVEGVKRIKINPMPRMGGLPWGLSLATGVIIAVLSLGPHLNMLSPVIPPAGSAPPSPAKALKSGEMPVEILNTSEISLISSKQGDGDSGEPQSDTPQNTFPMAPGREGGKWTKRADMPTPRHGLATCVVNGKIYAIGGGVLTHDDERLSTVEEYDPAADTWTKKTDMPTARLCVCTAAVNGSIYAISGTHAKDVFVEVEEYNAEMDTWSRKADIPTPRGGFSTSVVSGKIYAIGGTDSWVKAFSTAEEYDPARDKWTKVSDMPTKRAFLSNSAVNGKIYAIGGATPPYGEPNQGAVLAIVEEYDPETDTWTRKADMPTARHSLSTCVVNGKIYAIGGLDITTKALSIVEEYDPTTDTWTKKLDMPTARGGLSASVVNGKIYTFGGAAFWEGPGLPTVEEYDPETIAVSPRGELHDKLPTTWGKTKRVGWVRFSRLDL